MGPKIYLTIVAAIYLAFAVWCSIAPDKTARAVGFELLGGSGRSEYVAVYGGLEFGMALIFLMPWIRSDWTVPALTACLLIHAGLVIFRTIGFVRFSGIGGLTIGLAAGEIVIFVATLTIWLSAREVG